MPSHEGVAVLFEQIKPNRTGRSAAAFCKTAIHPLSAKAFAASVDRSAVCAGRLMHQIYDVRNSNLEFQSASDRIS
jgi:hypothetical protein